MSDSQGEARVLAALLRAHSAVTRELSAALLAEHGLTINDYEVLLGLADAPDRRLRRVDLSRRVLLTPSGMTRLLDGLERAGLVERADREDDRRVVYAVLTDAGERRLREAARTHRARLGAVLSERLDKGERDRLSDLLERLAGDGAAG